ncbi:MAG: L-aspartate oxidase [Blautia sp.]|nr:L-aspartate oxidase [Blautia sp.]
MKTDVLIVGSGCSGLYCALQLPGDKSITIVTKRDVKSSDSFLAQGGICMLKDGSDYDSYLEDTLRAGHYENDREAVDIMIRSSQNVIEKLIAYGVDFARDEDGELLFTREGAHSAKRILFHKDITGAEITGKLLAAVQKLPHVTVLEYTVMVDIVCADNRCYGAVLRMPDGSIETVEASDTVWACGGIGGLYRHSTNFRHLTGDALAVALQHGIRLRDINYVQVHPTTFYLEKAEERSFLISESVRGEGAKLYGKNMERFVDELAPRDVVTAAILSQMEKDGTEFVWEDLRAIPEEELLLHFPNIVEYCGQKGYDVTKQCIPVVPAQHYFMGGVWVDHDSKTSMEHLYAVGETACNGVHGKNRLASNSLLESMVFAGRAAEKIAVHTKEAEADISVFAAVEKERYMDQLALSRKNHTRVRDAIAEAELAADGGQGGFSGAIDGLQGRRRLSV